MKKIILSLIILISVSTIAYAEEIPGLPGRYEMNRAFILVGQPYLSEGEPYWCAAYYNYPSSDAIGNETDGDPNIKFVKVVINNKRVMAICKCTDESAFYEANAEVGYIIVGEGEYNRGCTLEIDGCVCSNGTGIITAAANHGDEPGGTVTLKCTFDLENCNELCIND